MKPMAKRNPTKYQQRRRVFLVYLPAAWLTIAFVCWGLAWLIKNAPITGRCYIPDPVLQLVHLQP